ncbi:MAG: nucleotidyltransferase domain-containing protein [Ruminococcus sp.]|nr:nucleotidyltransferase domain-containing protein [Ruminococcus sp.]
MIDIKQWIQMLIEKLETAFAGRIVFIGLQGSYARGEATRNSDIDIVVIFDELTADDMFMYDNILSTMPNRKLACGFISGKDELSNWEPSDLFQFYHDTIPIKGNLDFMLNLISTEAVIRAIKIGACNIYHACVHNMLHEKDMEMLSGLYKSAVFVIQAIYFHNEGVYIRKKSDLLEQIDEQSREIIEVSNRFKMNYVAGDEFIRLSGLLFNWSKSVINNTY